MKHGADWYKRDPQAYLGGVVGLTERQHAVYSVVLDLIYAHGGSCPNDAKWISGWFADLGAGAVRKGIDDLLSTGKLCLTAEGELTNRRAEIEAKTKEKLRESRRESGKKGGKISGESRKSAENQTEFSTERDGTPPKNNGLDEAHASSKPEAHASVRAREEERREDKSSDPNGSGADAPSLSEIIWGQGLRFLLKSGVPEKQARSELGKWRKLHGDERTLAALGKAQREGALDPVAFCEGVFRQANGNGRAEKWSTVDSMKLEGSAPLDPGETLDMIRAKRDRIFGPKQRGGTA